MLRSTFMGFEIAKRGIQTSQKGLDITGQNMVNWDSAGYTRQRVDQVSISPYANTSRLSYSRRGAAGQGVDIAGIGQVRDVFLDKRFRAEQSEQGYFETTGTILYDIESAMGEFNPLMDAGIRGSFGTLLSALAKFSEGPSSESQANVVQTEFKNLAQTLQQLSSNMNKVASQHKFDLGISANTLNEKLQRLANLNHIISENKGVSLNNPKYGPNELLDEQNLLLDEISKYGDIDVTVNDDNTVSVNMAGHNVVDGDKCDKVNYTENNNGTVSLRWSSSGKDCDFKSGSLKAYVDYINGRGTNVTSENENSFKGIPYYSDQLDVFASALADVVNNIIPDTYDADGNPATYKTLVGAISDKPDADGKYPVVTDIKITAENISISDEWLANSAYVISKPDSRNNNYIMALHTALSTEKHAFKSGSETFNGSFNDFVKSYAGILGEDYKFYAGRNEASVKNLTDLQDRKDSVSGVVMDEEVSSMMLYNKSLQASSRLLTTLDEALDVIINRTGLVGR